MYDQYIHCNKGYTDFFIYFTVNQGYVKKPQGMILPKIQIVCHSVTYD